LTTIHRVWLIVLRAKHNCSWPIIAVYTDNESVPRNVAFRKRIWACQCAVELTDLKHEPHFRLEIKRQQIASNTMEELDPLNFIWQNMSNWGVKVAQPKPYKIPAIDEQKPHDKFRRNQTNLKEKSHSTSTSRRRISAESAQQKQTGKCLMIFNICWMFFFVHAPTKTFAPPCPLKEKTSPPQEELVPNGTNPNFCRVRTTKKNKNKVYLSRTQINRCDGADNCIIERSF
jgi:hypothetical protein